ncbi:RagB/SusD family nutrient uptake outer membrane protein [Chryseolinea sp. H1M3-3]|uniref:RagB/SusD family nutrient uptake outer membrane protein n=1 Tax=Chryseolinea sp. H1M3-3 TaxID=3034144 RepID=UPI0023EE10C2|nr:RagB/SusD family nutrient uptake outer membrane protein [Chryseolinea sp. H1M3-3]
MKKAILLSILIIGGFTSCDDDLNIENPNQATVEAFWKNQNDAVAGVNAIYSTLHRGAISRWMPFYYIIRSDEGKSTSPATDIVNNMDQFLITDYNYGNAYGIWNDIYVGIFRANQVLDNVPAIEMDEQLKTRILGEAKFLRGLFYYNLVSLWGNVPLMLTTSKPSDRPETSSAEAVWAQIEKDLSEAANSLPGNYGTSDRGRATKGAAYALLAKALMQQQKYAEALTPLEWLVEGEGSSFYDLMPDYRDNFLVNTENNMESVFEWQFELNASENHDDDVDPRTDNLNYGTSIAQFFGPSGVGWSDGEANRWVVDEFLIESTGGGDRDPRLAASFLFDFTDEDGPDQTMIYGQTFTQRYGVGNKRVWFRKFQNDHWKDFEGYNSPNNWRYIRYADVLLMYAECLNAESATAEAYAHVDRVRERAGLEKLSVSQPGLTQQGFLEQLKHERLLELSGEGHRWNDLARWGDLGPALAARDPGFATFDIGKDERLPIPQQERDVNPLLEQNPMW